SPPGTDPYRALLEASESIALNRELPELFHDFAQRLHGVVGFDYLNLILHEPSRHSMRLHMIEAAEPTTLEPGLELPVDQGPSGRVWQTQEPMVLSDVDRESSYPAVMKILREHQIRSCCLLPLTTAQRRLGVLGFGSKRPGTYGEGLDFLKQVAAQVAVAVDNALNYQRAQSYQQQLARERDRLRVVLDVTNALVSNLDFRQLLGTISDALRRVIPHEYASLVLCDRDKKRLRLHALDFPGGRGWMQEEIVIDPDGSPASDAIRLRKPVLLCRADLERYSSEVTRRLLAEKLQSAVCTPMVRGEKVLGTLNVASLRDAAFSADDVELLSQVGNEVAIALENAEAFQQIAELKDRLAKEKLYLEDEIRTEYDFEEMVGESAAWRKVLQEIRTVAPTDSTVLLLGESGTGKELVARAIHNLSQRRERTFVKVNCSAIPTGLLESELFGHEKGAFTGAITQKVGRFELAAQGTLLLDEIGDISLELQPKLLRVLQEREFERLGGSHTIRADVRLIASTNRDLAQMVAGREFRGDLYYRLNVFPIVLPPLRERREDIPLLVAYFAQKYGQRIKKRIETIPNELLEALARWNWPGNVRELENFVERAVILSKGPELVAPLAELQASGDPLPATNATMEELERQHILRTLGETRWVVGGPRGAANRLGMKRTTLQSRMEKLGIRRPARA
ncbi:MAG TPA: sigma 54-interacting transcriptional regulator, partial [Bryobacteraceae bacterium]|nr:sigma 54-interacting transcriptional regulator [Bryobacteraceae bacterium]